MFGDLLEQPIQGRVLPRRVVGRLEHLVGGARELGAPSGRGPGRAHRLREVGESGQHVGEPPGDGDPAPLDAQREHLTGREADAVVAHRDAHEEAIDHGTPRTDRVAARDAPRRPMVTVESPSDLAVGGPARDRVEIVVVEVEPEPHRRQGEEVEHRRSREPSAHEVDQCRERAEKAVRVAQGPVGDAVREVRHSVVPVARAGAGCTGGGYTGGGTEDRLDDRCEGVERGAHDQDLVFAQRGIACEPVEDRVPEHLDLAARTVRGVDLDRAVVGCDVEVGRRHRAGTQI